MSDFGSPLARPIRLDGLWNASVADVAERFDPIYRAGLARLPDGDRVLRGLPFGFAAGAGGPRWILLDREVTVDLRGLGPASHLVVAHFADSWREPGGRPPGAPVGWVLPTGEPLARYAVTTADGRTQAVEVRRRFEIDDGIIGWGYLPFAAIGHRPDEVVDWRGPHARQAPGRYAATGHAGPMTILPGGWGPAQTGVGDHVPSATDDVTYWLHAIPLAGRSELSELRLVPLGGGRPGSDVVVAAMTLFDGTADPLAVAPRRQFLVEGFGDHLPAVDLGIAIRSRPPDDTGSAGSVAAPIGWGRPSPGRSTGDRAADGHSARVVDVALAADARMRFEDWEVTAEELAEARTSRDGGVTIRPLPSPDVRVAVTVTSGEDGEATPARVRFVSDDGRYLPPLGHRDEVNPGLFEDMGTDLILGRDTYAYVPGTFEIDLPVGAVQMEVVKGFDHRPARQTLTVEPGTRRLEIALERRIDLRPQGWMTADPHVHFLAPSTALMQAAAEDIALVHVLATQWGDQFTSVNDLPWGSMTDPSGRHAVVVGTENRQNMLGHLGLLGARHPILPMSSGGAPEGRIGGAVTELMADWADRCRAEGGLVVAAHFPLPFAEIATDIVTGRIDAVEMQVFAPGLDNPSILEWYRFLDCGYRLPVLGGTDKMSAEVPVGAVRTYARLDPDGPPSFDAWAKAVRAGRTFATSGPVIEFTVDGQEPGDVVSLPASGGRLEATVRVRAAQAVIDAVEIVVNGEVVATCESPEPTDDLSLDAPLDIRAGAWIAARSRSAHEIHSAFNTSMASHTSPIYVEVQDRPLFSPRQAAIILDVIGGTLRWVRDLAAVERPVDRARMVALIAASATTLRERIDAASRESRT